MTKIIYELGINKATNIPYYLSIADKVVLVDVNPEVCEAIKIRFNQQIEDGNLMVENCILDTSELATESTFNAHDEKHLLSPNLKLKKVISPPKKIKELICSYGEPYYIRINFENDCYKILCEFFNNNIYPPYISLKSTSIEIFSTLVAIGGYKTFKLANSRAISEDFLDLSASVHNAVTNSSVQDYASAPFENHLKAAWISAENFVQVLALNAFGEEEIVASKIDMPNLGHESNIRIQPRYRGTVSFVTVCKGRLSHIKETLPKLMQESPEEIIFVDYACPENSGDYVNKNFPGVKVIKVMDDDGFCLPRGRNIGAAQATSEFICFMDADINVRAGFVDWIRWSANLNSFYRHEKQLDGERDKETWGTFIVARNDFNLIGGFDEVFRGWGGEDDDIYMRLKMAEVQENEYPNNLVTAITHGDEFRTSFHQVKSKNLQTVLNLIYLDLKKIMLRSSSSINRPITKDLDYKIKLELQKLVSSKVRLDESGVNIIITASEFNFTVPSGMSTTGFGMEIKVKFLLNK